MSTFLAATAINTGLRYPLVMHALLAFSALHLSWTDDERRDVLLHEMKHSEEQGMMAFKKLDLVADPMLVIPCLLFSFITGLHRLCYALAYCSTEPDILVSSFTEGISLLRGVPVVIAGHMEVVRQSELGPHLIPAEDQSPRMGLPSDLKAIQTLKKICDPASLSQRDSEALMQAIKASYTSVRGLRRQKSEHSIGSLTVWMMKAPSDLVEMLNNRYPLALIVLAHTAPSLQHRRRCWAVGGSAVFLVDSVAEAIPTDWHHWLDWPRRAIY